MLPSPDFFNRMVSLASLCAQQVLQKQQLIHHLHSPPQSPNDWNPASVVVTESQTQWKADALPIVLLKSPRNAQGIWQQEKLLEFYVVLYSSQSLFLTQAQAQQIIGEVPIYRLTQESDPYQAQVRFCSIYDVLSDKDKLWVDIHSVLVTADVWGKPCPSYFMFQKRDLFAGHVCFPTILLNKSDFADALAAYKFWPAPALVPVADVPEQQSTPTTTQAEDDLATAEQAFEGESQPGRAAYPRPHGLRMGPKRIPVSAKPSNAPDKIFTKRKKAVPVVKFKAKDEEVDWNKFMLPPPTGYRRVIDAVRYYGEASLLLALQPVLWLRDTRFIPRQHTKKRPKRTRLVVRQAQSASRSTNGVAHYTASPLEALILRSREERQLLYDKITYNAMVGSLLGVLSIRIREARGGCDLIPSVDQIAMGLTVGLAAVCLPNKVMRGADSGMLRNDAGANPKLWLRRNNLLHMACSSVAVSMFVMFMLMERMVFGNTPEFDAISDEQFALRAVMNIVGIFTLLYSTQIKHNGFYVRELLLHGAFAAADQDTRENATSTRDRSLARKPQGRYS